MKRIVAVILCAIMVLSIAPYELKCFANGMGATCSASEELQSNNKISNLSDSSFYGVKGLDDFSNRIEEEYDVVNEELENGIIISHLNVKNSNNDIQTVNTTTNLAIPTIDNIKKLEKQQQNKPKLSTAPSLLKQSLEPLAEETTALGDVNADGKINNKDLGLLMQYLNNWDVTISESEADVNNDGKINNKDYGLLMQQINKWTPQPDPDKQYTYTTGQKHEKLHYSERYLYSTLTEEQQSWYQAIDKAVNNLDAEVLINYDFSIDRNYYIFYAYLFDNPEHFYLCNNIGICNNGDGTTTLNFYYSVGNQKGEYCGYGYGPLTDELREKIRAKKAVFEAEVDRIISTIPSNAPDIWKEKLVYDRILVDGYYNLSARWDGLANDNWTAYGLLVNKYGVCESYSEAFQTLCVYVGINCTGVVGTAGGGHKWNAVELDGEWYMCDITFDDPIGGEAGAAYHYYFNRTSEWFIENNHDWTNCDFSVPECNGTKYDFENWFGADRW